MAYEAIMFEKDGSIATITLNRPEALNAINRQLGNECLDALNQCWDDEEVRAIILKGAGRAFCAGDDIRGSGTPPAQRSSLSQDPLVALRQAPYYRLMKMLRAIPKPVITSVHGFAVGAGCDLVLTSDIKIAAEGTRFGAVFVQRAILGGTYFLAKYVGLGRATELLLTGDMFDAQEALRLGVVTRVVPPEQLEEETKKWAERMANSPTRVIGYIKHALNQGLGVGIDEGIEYQTVGAMLTGLTEDNIEGRTAFAEKRQPTYKGK
ncbi:MAG: enoyl-CoA hydratase/isomerase family protein [Candidatus Tectomicrobia bacterium]|nr:enoyl-CoA hydratase/isomerase family protein [Candidatus Tectomicrobia bacterium]